MTQILDIAAAVITEQVLRAHHSGEDEVMVTPDAIITPSAWDYLRFHRLRLNRGSSAGAPAPDPQSPAGETAIAEVLPPGSEAGVLSQGRCDHPDRAYGCRTEEFGSGFVEPSCCTECAVRKAQNTGARGCSCGGCNRNGTDAGTEALVQQLTDEIMKRLGQS